jgi:hypothetical protein
MKEAHPVIECRLSPFCCRPYIYIGLTRTPAKLHGVITQKFTTVIFSDVKPHVCANSDISFTRTTAPWRGGNLTDALVWRDGLVVLCTLFPFRAHGRWSCLNCPPLLPSTPLTHIGQAVLLLNGIYWHCLQTSKLRKVLHFLPRRRSLTTKSMTPIYCFHKLPHTSTHCRTLPHASTHFHTLPHTATHCHTLPHIATHCHTLPHTTTHCHTLPHASTHFLTFCFLQSCERY